MTIPPVPRQPGKPGLKNIIRLASLADVATFPDVPAGTYVLADDITFNASKGFRPIEVTLDTSAITPRVEGERDSKSYNNELKFMLPNLSAEGFEFLDVVANNHMIALVEDFNGKKFLLGRPGCPVEFDTNDNGSGDTNTSQRGMNITMRSTRYSPLEYTGTVTDMP